MCQSYTLLAQRDDRHLVTRCEHGTLHLIWDHAVFMLYTLNFVELVKALESWRESERGTDLVTECVQLHQLPSDVVQLWIVNAGLSLTSKELDLLTSVVCEAEACRRILISNSDRTAWMDSRVFKPYDVKNDSTLQN